MIAALYVQKDGCYFGLEGVDPWDEERDARLYEGPHPVVAHPPCARWCKLAKSVEVRCGIPVGADGGTFAAALEAVEKWGGVLEHPAQSMAFREFGLPVPTLNGWTKSLLGRSGWATEVCQSAYGHRAQKRTWLYYVGNVPPAPLDWRQPRGELVVALDSKRKIKSRGGGERMGHAERIATPEPFRELLLDLARRSAQ